MNAAFRWHGSKWRMYQSEQGDIMQFYKAWLANDHTVQRQRIVAQNVLQAAQYFIQEVEMAQVDFPVGSGAKSANVIVKTESGIEYKFIVSGNVRPVYSAEEVNEFVE